MSFAAIGLGWGHAMSAPDRGFALMRTSTALARAYDSSPAHFANRGYVQKLRALVPHVKPERYRGIGRYPLNTDYDYGGPGWQGDPRDNPSGGRPARDRLAQVLGAERNGVPQEEWLINGPWLVAELRLARELLDLVDKRNEYEIIEVARYPSRTRARSLGFDVGYWASGNFSLVCDTAVWPLWHPPDLQATGPLKVHLDRLNDEGLFSIAETALAFREWYKTQPWAEKEGATTPGRFEIVEIGLLPPRA